jgi:hypothetical protein
MNDNNNIYETITDKIVDCLDGNYAIPSLALEVKHLIKNYQNLTQTLFQCKAECTAEIVNEFFDSQRIWDGLTANRLVDKIIDCPKNDFKKLTLTTFVRAGLCIELAILAVEKAKDNIAEGPTVNIEPFESVFFLNSQQRNLKKSGQKENSNSGKSSSNGPKLHTENNKQNLRSRKRKI